MKRSKHNLSHYRLTTLEMGKLYPVACYEVLPGDTVQHASSALVRVSPLVAPVMHPVTVRIHHWFVPYRLLWDDWEDFITGGPDGTGAASAFPTVSGPFTTAGELPDHMGIKPNAGTGTFSDLPFRAYNMIYNENYRDEDLCAEVPLSSYTLHKVAWEKDYFTTARPWPQKGPDVTLPLGTYAPVVPRGSDLPTFAAEGVRNLAFVGGSNNTSWSGAPVTAAGSAGWVDPALVADLNNATAANVNDIRRAFALQRYQEARARYGSRYVEYLRYLGINPSDARLQRPEYLGGGKSTISFSEVLRTGNESAASTAPIGELAGHGITGMRSRRYRKFFEEHGVVLSLCSIRPRTMYTDGTARMWLRRQKEDFYTRELEMIGQQTIDTREVYEDGTSGVFGYQDRYSEYKHEWSSVTGEFRQLLDYWHYGRKFAAKPVLNASFVECDPTKRVYAEQTQNPLWCMFNHRVVARRMVSKSNKSRII